MFRSLANYWKIQISNWIASYGLWNRLLKGSWNTKHCRTEFKVINEHRMFINLAVIFCLFKYWKQLSHFVNHDQDNRYNFQFMWNSTTMKVKIYCSESLFNCFIHNQNDTQAERYVSRRKKMATEDKRQKKIPFQKLFWKSVFEKVSVEMMYPQ